MKHLFALLALLSFCLSASEFTRGENLISGFAPAHPYYEKYQLYAKSDPKIRSNLWVSKKPGELDTFKIDIVLGDRSADLEELQRSLDMPGEASCTTFHSKNISSDKENGYPQLTWETTCDKDDKSIYIIHKAISGKDNMYLVRKFWYQEVALDAVTPWITTISEFMVCDTRKERHPCPEGYKLAEPKMLDPDANENDL